MRYTEIKPLTEETLLEINMSPNKLRKLASTIDAKVGMEFEFYLPDVDTDNDDEDGENDYDQDESVDDFDDIRRFFRHSSGSRMIDRVIGGMQDSFHDWYSEKVEDDWNNYEREAVEEWVESNEDDFQDRALEEIQDQIDSDYEEPDEDDENAEPKREADIDDDDVQERAEELKEARIDEIISEGYGSGNIYQSLYDNFREDQTDEYSERDWLRDNGYYTMKDVYDQHDSDLDWPYRESSPAGDRSLTQIARDFTEFTGFAAAEGEFDEEEQVYGVSYDMSLQEKNDATDGGVEFSSPPMSVSEMFTHLKKVREFIESEGGYTNETCGLHISASIGVPDDGGGFDHGIRGLDYTKLAILLGDQHVLEQFDRIGNRFTKSAYQIVAQNAKHNPEKVEEMLNRMRQGLNNLSSKIIHSGGTEKFTSINNKGDYIEFRSAGNDWASDVYFKKIEDTTLRYIVALDAAMDPELYKEEYITKLSKLLTGSTEMEYYDPKDPANAKYPTVFIRKKAAGLVPVPKADRSTATTIAKFMAGAADKNEISSMLNKLRSEQQSYVQNYPKLPDRQTPTSNAPAPVQNKTQATNPDGIPLWEVYELDSGHVVHKFSARTEEHAVTVGTLWLEGIGAENPSYFGVRPTMVVASNAPATPDSIRQAVGRNIAQTSDANWQLYNTIGDHVIRNFHANSQEQAIEFRNQWMISNGRDPSTGSMFQVRPISVTQTSSAQKSYTIINTETGFSVVNFMAPNQLHANQKFHDYIASHPGHYRLEELNLEELNGETEEQPSQSNFEVLATDGAGNTQVLHRYYAPYDTDGASARQGFRDYLTSQGITSTTGYGYRAIPQS